MVANDISSKSGRLRLFAASLLVFSLAIPTAISQFLRNAMGVVAPNLTAEFNLPPADAGLMSSVFFFSFALIQIPLGPLIDVRGPKIAILMGAGLVAIGSIVFVTATGLPGLALGRILSGLGCGAFYMCALTIYARTFSKGLFSTIAGIHLALGNLGTLAATQPLAEATAAYGWRAGFLAVVAISLIGALLVAAVAPADRPVAEKPLAWGEAFRGLDAVFKLPDFWPIFLMSGTSVALFVTVAGLWAGPWLTDIHGYDLSGRGRMLLIVAVGQIIGVFIIGASDRLFRSYRRPVILCAGAIVLLLVIAAFVPLSGNYLLLWLALFGFSFGFVPVLTAHGRSLFHDALVGRGLTILNFAVMAGAFLFQLGTGWIVQAIAGQRVQGYPPAAYQAVFLTLALVVAILLVSYCRTTERHPLRMQ